jgi:hypothetical protein
VTVILLAVSVTGFAAGNGDEEQGASAPAGGRDIPFKAEMAVGLDASISGMYMRVDPSVVWKPGAFAAGIGTEFLFGATRFEIYALPYLRMELGWFYLAGGYNLPLLRGVSADVLDGFSVGFGIAPEPFLLGYGRAGFDLSFDLSVPALFGSFAATRGDSLLSLWLNGLLRSSHLGIGFTYSFYL